jgi:chromosome partitioning protein
MPVISFLSQKGGSGKSTLCRLALVEFSRSGWNVIAADMDESQSSIFSWNARRSNNKILPEVEVIKCGAVKTALRSKSMADLLLIDGKPFADVQTLEIAKNSDLIVIPTGVTLDDLEPSLNLGRRLINSGIDVKKLLFVPMKSPSDSETRSTISSIEGWGFKSASVALEFKSSYGRAMDDGYSVSEVKFERLKGIADQIVEQIANKLTEGQK